MTFLRDARHTAGLLHHHHENEQEIEKQKKPAEHSDINQVPERQMDECRVERQAKMKMLNENSKHTDVMCFYINFDRIFYIYNSTETRKKDWG